MASQQQQLSQLPPVVRDLDDFIGLFPPGVMPTKLYVLEQNDHLIFFKHYKHGEKISKKQDRIYKLLVRLGELDLAPGSVSVMAIWGIRGVKGRAVVQYDYTGEHEVPVTDHSLRQRISDWWHTHRSGYR